MAQLNLNLPIIGNPNTTEDPKIRTALSDIETVVNSLDNTNIAANAGINGSKLLDASIAEAKLGSASVTSAKLADNAVTTAKIDSAAVTAAKIAAATTATATNESNFGGFPVTGTLTARKYADGLVVCQGSLSCGIQIFAGTTFATLPAGYRPAAELTTLVPATTSSAPKLTTIVVGTNGQLQVASGSPSATPIVCNLVFHAA